MPTPGWWRSTPLGAEHAPGVRGVTTGRDFPFTFGASIKDQPFLAIDRVRFVGEPVVAVAADTELQAQEALDLITVHYEELPAVLDPWEALAQDAPLVHPDLHTYRRGGHEIVPHSNINTVARYVHGDVEEGFRQADLLFEDEFFAHALSHAAMETHAAIAQYRPADRRIHALGLDRPALPDAQRAGRRPRPFQQPGPADRRLRRRVLRRQEHPGRRGRRRGAGAPGGQDARSESSSRAKRTWWHPRCGCPPSSN